MINKPINIKKRKLIKNIGIGLMTFPFIKGIRADYKPKVVILGGGFGGGTCLNALDKISDKIDLVLIEKNKYYYTCPFSNSVIGGFRSISQNRFSYESIKKRNFKFINREVNYVDSEKKIIKFSDNESIKYDWLVISPGVDYKWDEIIGYNQAVNTSVPHGWNGRDALKVYKKVKSLSNNAVILISAPDYPYKCPPAPYERASLIAHYLKKKGLGFKIFILDNKDSFTKQDLFFNAWKRLYPNSIEWISRKNGGKVKELDLKNKVLVTEGGQKFKGNYINIIPNQKASNILLQKEKTSDDWFEVNPRTFEIKGHKFVHAIGDSINAGDMPKSAFSANSQAKVCAENIKNMIFDKDILDPVFLNTCYSYASPKYAFSISSWYRVNLSNERITSLGSQQSDLYPSLYQRNQEVEQSKAWYKAITTEIFNQS